MLLQLGLYQMFWLDRIPNHAAVHETVELAKQLGLGPQAGFVNAVLRGYARERDATEKLLRGIENFAAGARAIRIRNGFINAGTRAGARRKPRN